MEAEVFMDMQSYFTPWDIGGAVAGLLLSIATIISLVLGRRQLGAVIKNVGERLFSQVGFFSLVIVVFMLISVLESGSFFDQAITHHAILGLLGYALALGFDLVSIVCMQARLNAARMRDERGQRLNLIGVIICAAVSAFANACGSLQGYNPVDLDHTPLWMQTIAPWIGMVFPTMIIVLAMTSDHLLEHTLARDIDVDTYRKQEQKRVDILRVRLDMQRDLLKLEHELSTLRRRRDQAGGHVQREWFWTRWIRPPIQLNAEQHNHEGDEALKAARVVLEEHSTQLQTALDILNRRSGENTAQVTNSDQALHTLSARIDKWTTGVTVHLSTIEAGMGIMRRQVDALSLPSAKRKRLARPDQEAEMAERSGHSTAPEESERSEPARRIRAAIQRLGTSASDRQIAREANCSPTTVARWKQKWRKQGQLVEEAKKELSTPEIPP